MPDLPDRLAKLALFHKFVDHAMPAWSAFQFQRRERLVQATRNEGAAEKVAENIVEDFFTSALDWSLSELNNQVQYADIVLTKNGIKRLVVEVKRPGAFSWEQRSLEQALEQARRYATEQRVHSIAVTDGTLFYAADIENGGLVPRARFSLDVPELPLNAWWVSVDGVYRTPQLILETQSATEGVVHPLMIAVVDETTMSTSKLLHPKYKIPAHCFAYVGDATDTKTWKLPCCSLQVKSTLDAFLGPLGPS